MQNTYLTNEGFTFEGGPMGGNLVVDPVPSGTGSTAQPREMRPSAAPSIS